MSKLICRICHGVAHIGFGDGLSKDWPKCCGKTMDLQRVSRKEIEAGVAEVMKPLSAIKKRLK